MINASYTCNYVGQGERKVDYHRDDDSVSYTVDLLNSNDLE